MATKKWIGAAQAVARVVDVTLASIAINDVITITIGTASFTFTATTTVIADSVAGLIASAGLSSAPQISEIAWSANGTTKLRATGLATGKPFTLSAGLVGTGTATPAVVTAGTGPNYWTNTANWDTGSLPATGDTVIIDNTNTSILYGIDKTSVALGGTALAELRIGAGFTGQIGLPENDPAGYRNTGYRCTFLEILATLINSGAGYGTGSGRIKINADSVVTTLTVFSTGQPAENGLESFQFLGSNVANAVNVLGGSVGMGVVDAVSLGGAATVTTLLASLKTGSASANQPPTFRVGQGATLTTLTANAGTGTIGCAMTTVNNRGAKLTLFGTGAVTTINNDAGSIFDQSSGTITNLNSAGLFRFDSDVRSKTVSNCNIYAGSEKQDPGRRVTWTNGIVINHCTMADVKLNTGPVNITFV